MRNELKSQARGEDKIEMGQDTAKVQNELKSQALARLAGYMIDSIKSSVPGAALQLQHVRELQAQLDEQQNDAKPKRKLDSESTDKTSKILKTNHPSGHTAVQIKSWANGLNLPVRFRGVP